MNKLLIVLTVIALTGCSARVSVSTITKAALYCQDKLGIDYIFLGGGKSNPSVRCMNGTLSPDLTLWNPINE